MFSTAVTWRFIWYRFGNGSKDQQAASASLGLIWLSRESHGWGGAVGDQGTFVTISLKMQRHESFSWLHPTRVKLPTWLLWENRDIGRKTQAPVRHKDIVVIAWVGSIYILYF